ncbi:hypothetical protein SDD30_01625 [Moorella naiadis]|uniref:hypothetical protein n=1 Tax=Moorella naiadis (nom. illeg.) TaxID=3093670 RepID=UPI003D9C92B1
MRRSRTPEAPAGRVERSDTLAPKGGGRPGAGATLTVPLRAQASLGTVSGVAAPTPHNVTAGR